MLDYIQLNNVVERPFMLALPGGGQRAHMTILGTVNINRNAEH